MKSANPEHWDFYHRFRERVRMYSASPAGQRSRWREWLLLGPDLLHLAIRLVREPEVPVKHKARLAAAIAYFISPVDLLPEAVFGPFGYLDDIAITAYVLDGILNDVPQHILDRHWAGDDDLLTVIRSVVKAADRVLGKGLWRRLTRRMDVIDAPDPKQR